MSNNKLAIFLIITSVFFGTVMLSFLKIAQEDVNVYVAGFLQMKYQVYHLFDNQILIFVYPQSF